MKKQQKGILKQIGELFSVGLDSLPYLAEFLDASGIKKKRDYQKEIAENTAKILELQNRNK